MLEYFSIRELQQHVDTVRQEKKRIAFVPTMGALHEGHLALMHEARKHADVLVVSIFVNPAQFSPSEDLAQYPRPLDEDKKKLQSVNCDILVLPSPSEMYPPGFESFVGSEHLQNILEGASRPGHFRGVTTVVSKLFNAVKPHVALFGQKDAQQAIAIKRMVRDLNFDIEIIIIPTVREKDGLAMSSRNSYLSSSERIEATHIYKSLSEAEHIIRAGERSAEKIRLLIEDELFPHVKRIDYIAVVSNETLVPRVSFEAGEKILLAVAVIVGTTRLVDNILVQV